MLTADRTNELKEAVKAKGNSSSVAAGQTKRKQEKRDVWMQEADKVVSPCHGIREKDSDNTML